MSIECPTCVRLREERDAARYNAAILVHAYDNDNRPPAQVVDESRQWQHKNRSETAAMHDGLRSAVERMMGWLDTVNAYERGIHGLDDDVAYRHAVDALAEYTTCGKGIASRVVREFALSPEGYRIVLAPSRTEADGNS